MVSNLDKKAIINMENTASYQPRSNLNIAFSTADRDSAVFVFNVTKDNKPILLSNENVTGHIALEHSDGSFVKDTLHFTEPNINGRFEYYIPNDILKREGTVTMQIFISEKGNSNVTVAERIVTFDIEKSIISQISAETKLQYIVEYDELQTIITNRIADIEDKMANAKDYVSQIEQAREKGLTDIEIAKTDSVKALNDLADKRLEEINSKANEYSSKFDDDKQYMDDKHQAFKESVLNSGVVTQGESSEWQKYKFTEDDGTIKYYSKGTIEDVKELPAGLYETVSNDDATGQGIPLNNSYVQIKVWEANLGRKEIELTSTYNNKKYFRLLHTNGDRDSGWIEVPTLSPDEEIETKNSAESRANETLTEANKQIQEAIINNTKDSGWIEFNLINGAKKNTEYTDEKDNAFKCSYRIIEVGNEVRKIVRLNGQNVANHQIIANLPSGITENAQVHWLRTPLRYSGGIVVIRPDGSVDFQVIGEGRENWGETDYFYGEITWSDYVKK